MPPNAVAAALTDRYRRELTLVRETTVDAVTAMLARGVDFDVGPLALERSLAGWGARAGILVTAAAAQSGEASLTYLGRYLAAGGLDVTSPGVVPDAQVGDLAQVRSALLWRLSRREGREVALGTAEDVARRVGRTAIAEVVGAVLAEGIDVEPGIIGWRRVTGPRCCGRCAATSAVTSAATVRFALAHPGDRCTPEPVLAGVPEVLVRRAPTVVAP